MHGTPYYKVPAQQEKYLYDGIGNRTFAKEGGDSNGNGLRRSAYSVDSVNQYSSRTNAGGFDMIGIANALASVTVNNQTTYRKGEYFQKELSVNNTGGAQYQQITNIASIPAGGGSLVSSDGGQVYVPPATETFTHDMDGNLTQNGRWNLAWDAENRLTNVAARNGSETATNVAFQYDNLWRRTYKKASLNNGTYSTNRFAYDGWNVVAEFDGATNILKSYMWGKDLSGSEQGAGGVGGLISMTIHSGTYAGTYFYAYDGNGNVTALINATNGAVSARYEYDPFHNLIRATGPLAKLNNFLAATKYYDWEIGFYYYGYRYYEPDTGRWLSRDPLGMAGGLNLFGMLKNDTPNLIDLLGLAPGDKFKTRDAAAKDALNFICRRSKRENKEYCGLIYKLEDGNYSYTEPAIGTGHNCNPFVVGPPEDSHIEGYFHSHGEHSGNKGQYQVNTDIATGKVIVIPPDNRPGFNDTNFSAADKDLADGMEAPGYLVTPFGDMKRYDPDPNKNKKGKVVKLGKCPCK